MGTNVTPIMIILSDEERAALEQRARSTKAPYRTVLRASVVLLLATLLSISEVARRTGLNRRIVKKWQVRFEEERLAGLEDLPRSGRPARFSPRSGPASGQARLRAA